LPVAVGTHDPRIVSHARLMIDRPLETASAYRQGLFLFEVLREDVFS
jgi:hypothetical protein